jgi:hypothetical protein
MRGKAAGKREQQVNMQSNNRIMAEHTAFGIATTSKRFTDYHISLKERELLRILAEELAELASRPEEAERRQLWYDHNALKPTRPLILCDPENGWNEILPEKNLKSRNEIARAWELALRKEIFWAAEMGDDRVCEPVFNIPYVYNESNWGFDELKTGVSEGGSFKYETRLFDYEKEFHKLKFPEIRVDYEATERNRAFAEELFGDLIKVKVKGIWWWTLGLTWTVITIRGLENFMTDMCLYPDHLKRLMAFLRDGILAKLDFLEENGLLSLNNDGTYVCSGGFGYTHELPSSGFEGKVRPFDMWGFSESQETVSVHPDMFEEFVFQYQLPIAEKFGLNCYGCCEPLDSRWHIIKKLPRLRRISVSPWADVNLMSEYLGQNYIFSRKPSPTDISVPNPDWNRIRKNLREFTLSTRNNRTEIIMKDNHTIGNNPDNVKTWCRIAQEEAANI